MFKIIGTNGTTLKATGAEAIMFAMTHSGTFHVYRPDGSAFASTHNLRCTWTDSAQDACRAYIRARYAITTHATDSDKVNA